MVHLSVFMLSNTALLKQKLFLNIKMGCWCWERQSQNNPESSYEDIH